VVDEIRQELKRNLGIIAQVQAMDTQPFYTALDSGSLQGLYLMGWGADYPEISNFLDTHFGEAASLQFGDKFQDILDALGQAAAVLDPLARRPDYEAVNNALRQHVPMIPLAHGGWISPHSRAVAYQAVVQSGHASPISLEDFAALSINGADTFTWMQEYEPDTLYCADETDLAALRICAQVTEPLYRYTAGSIQPQPALAEYCRAEPGLLVWTCGLRQGVLFQDGSTLDANDVVFSLWVQWDASHPLHKGSHGTFAYWNAFWGAFLNSQ
jgi:peptide/nickel transport system substrate-binding protein